jgi:hypothetical protein
LTVAQLKQIAEIAPDGSRQHKAAFMVINLKEHAYNQWKDQVVEAGHAENAHQAMGMLRHSPFNGGESLEDVLTWTGSYRATRDIGGERDDAVEAAGLALQARTAEPVE